MSDFEVWTRALLIFATLAVVVALCALLISQEAKNDRP